jgi:hypothetical protein
MLEEKTCYQYIQLPEPHNKDIWPKVYKQAWKLRVPIGVAKITKVQICWMGQDGVGYPYDTKKESYYRVDWWWVNE